MPAHESVAEDRSRIVEDSELEAVQTFRTLGVGGVTGCWKLVPAWEPDFEIPLGPKLETEPMLEPDFMNRITV